MKEIAFNCASIHCMLHMIVLHNKAVLLKPIIEKLRLGRLEKLYNKFNNIWNDEVSYNLFRFYFLHYRKDLNQLTNKRCKFL